MAIETVTTSAAESNTPHDWQSERKEMAGMVQEHILDSFAIFAGMLSEQDAEKGFYPALDDVGRVLKLMIEGAHVELALYCSSVGAPVSYPLASIISDAGVGA